MDFPSDVGPLPRAYLESTKKERHFQLSRNIFESHTPIELNGFYSANLTQTPYGIDESNRIAELRRGISASAASYKPVPRDIESGPTDIPCCDSKNMQYADSDIVGYSLHLQGREARYLASSSGVNWDMDGGAKPMQMQTQTKTQMAAQTRAKRAGSGSRRKQVPTSVLN